MKTLYSSKRDKFFRDMGLKWYNLCPIDEETGMPIVAEQVPYGMYHCEKVSTDTVSQIKYASEEVGRVFSKILPVIKGLSNDILLDYGFPKESIRLIKADSLVPMAMRLDWCWNEGNGIKKVIETNCQTPSFWFECFQGNTFAANYFGMQDPNPNCLNILRTALYKQIKKAATLLGLPLSKCHVAFTALNNPEDMGTMVWMKKQLDGSGINTSAFPIELLSIKEGQGLYHAIDRTQIDILFMWYPLEWSIYDVDDEGRCLWPALEDLLLQNKVVIPNFASAFSLQPKSIFALISDLGFDYFGEDAATVFDYFPLTSMSREIIGDEYFAKPILGRQGQGGYAVRNSVVDIKSSNNSQWYTEQPYVYQELLEFPTVEVEDKNLTALWGSWLLNNGRDEFVSAAVGIRLSESSITDDYSYWCPVGE